jgi:ATP/maltotriose-dependent transcriptional regulator MalT
MQAIRATERSSPPSGSASLVPVRGAQLLREGRVSAALAELDALRGSGVVRADGAAAVPVCAALLDCRLARGELAEALVLGAELAASAHLPGAAGGLVHHACGELSAALGEHEQAAEHFRTAGERMGADDDDPELAPWRAGAALAAVRLGRRPEAAALAHEHLEVARAHGTAYAVAQALRTLASTDARGDRILLLRRARAELATVTAARLAAQIDTDLAGLLLLTAAPGAATEALGLLRDAEDYAGREELWPLSGRVRRLLERLGEAPRRRHGEALAALTAAERRVAGLAAEGLTNRQVAQRLTISVKAVEWHLSHVYRKLGIASRAGLVSVLGAA